MSRLALCSGSRRQTGLCRTDSGNGLHFFGRNPLQLKGLCKRSWPHWARGGTGRNTSQLKGLCKLRSLSLTTLNSRNTSQLKGLCKSMLRKPIHVNDLEGEN